MGATIHGCGHAAQLFDVHYMSGTPQVHLHFMSEDDTYASDRHGTLEIVCHGCGASQLVLFEPRRISKNRHHEVSSEFQRQHQGCPDEDYDEHCPNYRRTVEVLDLRGRISTRPSRRARARAE